MFHSISRGTGTRTIFSATSTCLLCCLELFPWLQSIWQKFVEEHSLLWSHRRTRGTYHELRRQTSLEELVTRVLHILGLVIGATGTAPKDDMDVRVTLR
jgi:hypothetical protein